MPAQSTNSLPAQTLRIMRGAMMTMLLVFVCVVWFVQRDTPPNPEATPLGLFRQIGFAMSVAALVGIVVLRGVRRRAPVEARGTWGLVGSALSEAAALFGGVYYFLGGGLDVFAAGLVVFLLSWTLLPADPEAV